MCSNRCRNHGIAQQLAHNKGIPKLPKPPPRHDSCRPFSVVRSVYIGSLSNKGDSLLCVVSSAFYPTLKTEANLKDKGRAKGQGWSAGLLRFLGKGDMRTTSVESTGGSASLGYICSPRGMQGSALSLCLLTQQQHV